MLACPFCGIDYSETGLQDGRCRMCGGVVAWEDDDDDDDRETYGGPIGPGKSDTHREMGRTLPTQPEQRDLDSKELTKLNEIWRGTMDSNVQPQMTIKADTVRANDDTLAVSVPARRLSDEKDPAADLSDYELLDVIGEGGVGVVYAARQASIDRTVAVKMLRSETADNPEQRDKFLLEAVVTGDLDHPNIVPIYDLGANFDGALFYAMKRVQGTPWLDVIEEKPLSENLEILLKVCDAVAFAHSRGIVHRDLKPENTMLGEFGEVLVMDWGIAVSMPSSLKSVRIRQSHAMGGTPVYMAPEMATGPFDKIGPASDIYLLGAILYEVITGEPPHNGATVMACLKAAAANRIQPTNKSGELLDIAMKAMSTEPGHRHATVQDFQADIRQYQSHSESIALSTRAERELGRAETTKDYQSFARSLFAFQESYELWNENEAARAGVSRAKMAYASSALAKDDIDLGVSLLDASDPTHADLLAKLKRAKQEREARQFRLKNVRRLAALLLLTIFAGSVVASVIIYGLYDQAQDSLKAERVAVKRALDEEEKARNEEAKARDAEGRALIDKRAAIASKAIAEQQMHRADEASEAALQALEKSRREVRRREQLSYLSDVSLAAEKISGNAYSDALSILQDPKVTSHARAQRHWEWGRLMFLCRGSLRSDSFQQQAVHTLESSFAVESADGRITPEGILLVAGCRDGVARLWRQSMAAADHLERKPPLRIVHGGAIFAVALSPKGRYLATGGRDGEIKVWDLSQLEDNAAEMREPLVAISAHDSAVLSLAFSHHPDDAADSRLLSASRDQFVRLWDWRRNSKVHSFVGHTAAVWSAAFSPKGDRVVSGSEDHTVRVWSVADGVEVDRFSEHHVPVFAVAVSPRHDPQDPNRLLIASGGYDKNVLLWSSSSRKPVADALISEIQLRLENRPVRKREITTLPGHLASIRSLSFGVDGRVLASGGRDNTICLWDVEPKVGMEEGPIEELRSNAGGGQLLKKYRGHGGWVSFCKLSNDGDWVLSAGYDGKLKLWSILGYEEHREFKSDVEALDAAFSPNGDRVAVGLSNGRVQVWDRESRELLLTLKEGHEYLTSNAAYSAKDAWLVTVAGDNTLRQWDAKRGVQLSRAIGAGRRGLLGLSETGEWLVTGSDKKLAKLWRMTAQGPQPVTLLDPGVLSSLRERFPNRNEKELLARVASASAVAISPDSKSVFAGHADGRGWFWEVERPQSHWALPSGGHSLAITVAQYVKDGDYLLTGSADNTMILWDVRQRPPRLLRRTGFPDAVSRIAYSADVERVAVACQVKEDQIDKIRLWDWTIDELTPPAGEFGQTIRAGDARGGVDRLVVNSVQFAPDNHSLLVVGFSADDFDYQILKWDLDDGSVEPYRPDKEQPDKERGLILTAQYSPKGKQLLTVGGKGARSWDVNDDRELMNYRAQRRVTSVDFHPAGNLIAASSGDGSVRLWALNDEATALKIIVGDRVGVNSVCFHPDGRNWLLTACDDGSAQLWKQAAPGGDWERSGQPMQHPDVAVNAAVFSPDGATIATAASDGNAYLWSVETGQVTHKLAGHSAPVTCVAFSPKGDRLITGGEDNVARVWQWEAGQWRQLVQLVGHSAPVTSVSFSPDGERILTGSQDNSAKIWNPDRIDPESEVQNEILTLRRHERQVKAVSFSADGRMVLTASTDGRALVWPAVTVEPSIDMSLQPCIYELGQPASQLDPGVRVNNPSFVGAAGISLTVSVDGPTSEDHFELHAEGELVLQDNAIVDLRRSSPVATFQGGQAGQPLVIQFTGQPSARVINDLLRSIYYRSGLAPEAENQPTSRLARLQLGKQDDSFVGSEVSKEIRIPSATTENASATEMADPKSAEPATTESGIAPGA